MADYETENKNAHRGMLGNDRDNGIEGSFLSHFQQLLRENVTAQQSILNSSIAGHIDKNHQDTQNELAKIAQNVPLDCLGTRLIERTVRLHD